MENIRERLASCQTFIVCADESELEIFIKVKLKRYRKPPQNTHVLLSEGDMDVDEENMYGNIALHEAAKFGCTEMAIVLVAGGAGLDICNVDEDTALHIAVKRYTTS